MARIRKGCAYHRLERPYTRVSKYRKLAFVRARPSLRVVRFDMGDPRKKYDYTVILTPKKETNLRDNALESARMVSLRVLEKNLGTTGYFMKLRPYPFHILREHALAAGAGADRFSSGMAHSFGKPIGNAARVRKGQIIFEIGINKANLDLAKKALVRASQKLPCSCWIQIKDNKKV